MYRGSARRATLAALFAALLLWGISTQVGLTTSDFFDSETSVSNPIAVDTEAGQILIVKDAQPNGSQAFGFTTTNLLTASFNLVDNSDSPSETTDKRRFGGLPPGTYSIVESPVAGWVIENILCSGATLTTFVIGNASNNGGSNGFDAGDDRVTVNLAEDEQVACQFFNNQRQGKITIVKDSQPNSTDSFSFTTVGSGLSSFSLVDNSDNVSETTDTKVFEGLAAGVYKFTEADFAGYDLELINCTKIGTSTFAYGDGPVAFALGDKSVTVTLAEDDQVVCTFTNDKRLGKITVVKDTAPNNAEAFAFTTTNLTPSGFNLTDNEDASVAADHREFANLAAGSYKIKETANDDWDLDSITCTGLAAGNFVTGDSGHSVTINLTDDANVTCTFKNVPAPPPSDPENPSIEDCLEYLGYPRNYDYHAQNSQVNVIIVLTSGVTTTGGNGNDIIIGTDGIDNINGNNGNDCIVGRGGNDSLQGNNNNDFIFGGDGVDGIQGGNDNDVLHGGKGNDTIDGNNGEDKIYGEAGDDTITAGQGQDIAYGGPGADEIHGNDGDDKLYGDDGAGGSDAADRIYGESGQDEIHGAIGDDTIDGGDGDDKIYGDAGNDTLIGNNNNDTIFGGIGDDTIDGDNGNDKLYGEAGDDTIDGGASNDELYGGTGDDTLTDDQGDDKLYGEAGDDTLNGGANNDTLDGGPDFDYCDAGGGSNPAPINCENPGDLDVTIDSRDGQQDQDGNSGFNAQVAYTLTNQGVGTLSNVTISGTFNVANLTGTSVGVNFTGAAGVLSNWGACTTTATTWSCDGDLGQNETITIRFTISGPDQVQPASPASGRTITFHVNSTTCTAPNGPLANNCVDGGLSDGNFDSSDLSPADDTDEIFNLN